MNALTLTRLNPSPALVEPTQATPVGQESFANVIGAAMQGVERAQTAAKQASADLLLEGNGDVHMVALAAQKAELSLELFQQVRNKFVSAYQEVMKMPM